MRGDDPPRDGFSPNGHSSTTIELSLEDGTRWTGRAPGLNMGQLEANDFNASSSFFFVTTRGLSASL